MATDPVTPRRGANVETAVAHGTPTQYGIAVDVLAALSRYMRTIDHEVDDFGAYHPDGRSWWIRFRRRETP